MEEIGHNGMDKNFTQARWKTSTIDSSFFIVTLENALLVLNTPYIGSENLINLAARSSFENIHLLRKQVFGVF